METKDIAVPADACLAHLLPVMEDNTISVIHLDKPVTRIGRIGFENDVTLDSKTYPFVVSRKHMTIARNGDGSWVATDVGSKNGVIVNGIRVLTATLRAGDQVMIGGAANVTHGSRTNPLTDLAYVFQVAGEGFVPSSSALVPLAPVEKRKARDADVPSAQAERDDEDSKHKNKAKEAEKTDSRSAEKAKRKAAETKEKEESRSEKSVPPRKRRSQEAATPAATAESAAAAAVPVSARRKAAQRWHKGDEVEAKCQNADVPEVNAWFRSRVLDYRAGKYHIRYLDDDGKPYDEAVDEWLQSSCVRETSTDYEPIKAKVGSLLSVKRKKNGWYYDARVAQIHHTDKESSQPMFTVEFEDSANTNFVKIPVAYEDTFWVREQSSDPTPSAKPLQPLSSTDDSE